MSARTKRSHGPKAKMSFRHNVLPPLLGIMMFGSVLGLLNSEWIVAQAEYHFAPKVSADTVQAIARAKAPANSLQLNIPALGVTAPVIYESSMADWQIQIDLRSGVVHLGPTAVPGHNGNIVVVGHSSQVPWAPGNYKFVFTLLDKLKKGDVIMIDYQGTRYIYRVTSSEVVDPTNVSVLQPTEDPELSLITCTPVGTSKNRLVVHAKQVSPNPNTVVTNINQNKNQKTTLTQLPQ